MVSVFKKCIWSRHKQKNKQIHAPLSNIVQVCRSLCVFVQFREKYDPPSTKDIRFLQQLQWVIYSTLTTRNKASTWTVSSKTLTSLVCIGHVYNLEEKKIGDTGTKRAWWKHCNIGQSLLGGAPRASLTGFPTCFRSWSCLIPAAWRAPPTAQAPAPIINEAIQKARNGIDEPPCPRW